MGNVYSITLCDRDLHHVPDDIYKHHKHVAKLLLRRNNIQEIPPDIKVLTNLLELSLRDNLLSSVPVERNRFTTIPDCVFELKSLTILLLQKNRITTISPKVGQCTQLVSLNLSYNRLQYLPIELKECKSLQHLLLSVNTIQMLPAILCESWTNLLNLDLHTNELKVLPDQLGAMKSLRRLNLAINKIDEIPASIGQLSLLEWLNLNDNKLTTLPSTMDQMQKLVKMGIVQNKLQTLPAALAKLSALYKLDCRRNEIEFLPSSFKELQGIHSLLLEENPMSFRYGVSNYSRQPPSLLELAARSVLDRYCPQERALSTQSSSSSSSSTSSSCPSPQPDTGIFNTATDAVSVMGIAHLIPTMADLGLTKGSTITPPHSLASTPQKSRYNFFSRACATVHPSPSKPTRSSTLSSTSSASSSSSSSSSSASSAVAPSISSSLTGSSLAQGTSPPCSPAEVGRFSRKRLSPKPIKGRSFFHKPLILQSQTDGPKKSHTLLDSQPQQPTPQGQGHFYQSTRKIHKSRLSHILDPETSFLPLALIDLLGQPITPCDYCERRMCTSGWVDFLEPAKLGTSRMIIPVRHRMCSLQCVRQQYQDSFGGEMTDSFETTDFHIGPNGEMVGSRPIVPSELDEYMIEAVQEAADQAGISITHLLEQYHQHQRNQNSAEETATNSDTATHETETPQIVDAQPGSISMMAINQMVSANVNSGQSANTPLTGPASLIRQTTARLRRSLSRPLTPIEIQIDAQGQLRRVVYRQARNTSHRRRFLETFRSLSQVGQGNGTGLGVLTAAGIGANPGIVGGNGGPGFVMGQGDATAVPNRGANNRAGEVMNVTTFAVELERF
ncbi:hypothetical protein BGZ92_010413 [Podila epicladia]|nr:hypothetical protein BGZ92_010413 [Podila epicladia]